MNTKQIKKGFKKVVRNALYFIIGVLAFIYYTLKGVNTIAVNLFNKLPRLVRVTAIYSLIALSVIGVINYKPQIKTIIEEKIQVITIEKEIAMVQEEQKQEVIEETSQVLFNNENENNIYNYAIEQGLTQKQALLVISISRHETGNWTSKAFKNNHNFGGIMTSKGLKNYNSYEEGLQDFVRILKNYYFDLGLDTIEKIGAKYCPVGAKNDPNNLNQYWVGGVSQFYNNYLEELSLM